MGRLQSLRDPRGPRKAEEGFRGSLLAGPGQEVRQADRELGSGDPAGVSSGAWGGLRFLPAAKRVWSYQPAWLPSQRYGWGGGGYKVDPGTLSLLSPKKSWHWLAGLCWEP